MVQLSQPCTLSNVVLEAATAHRIAVTEDRTTECWQWELLQFACLLHGIGYHISYNKHQKHAYYLIKNSELNGFEPREIDIMANVARYHMKSYPKKKHQGLWVMSKADQKIVLYLSALLRLADALDRSQFGVITDISQIYATNTARGWELSLGCCGLARRIELALNEIVNNGRYAQILQLLRLNNLTNGELLGVPSPSGVLFEPIPFASSEAGTIPTTCISAGPVSLPQTNCISAFLQAGCAISTTFTGVTGQSSNIL